MEASTEPSFSDPATSVQQTRTETLQSGVPGWSGIAPQAGYRELLKAARVLRRSLKSIEPGDVLAGLVPTSVTVVGNSTLSFLADPLMVRLANRGVQAIPTIGGYGGYLNELLDPQSSILAACPRFLVIHLDHHAIQQWPQLGDSPERCDALASELVEFWSQLWRTAHEGSGCTVIQTNIVIPPEKPLGSCDSTLSSGRIHFLRRVNEYLSKSLPEYVVLCDVEQLSGTIGKRTWFDLPHWYASRQPVQFDALGEMADLIAGLIAAQLGRSRKCLVLDLDNTMWGGVVGDVGREGLRLQRGDAVGEAHLDFQMYCRQLKQRGVLLAVCSKNEERIAKDVFENHPEMVLRLEDISCFVANWDDKASNLRRIAGELNIGVDSLVFVDDHPGERELVRQLLPQVAVPELPADPAHYVRALDQHGYFETTRLSSEDVERTTQYQAQRARDDAQSSFADLESFLRSLDQRCEIAPLDAGSMLRTVQLLNKTNQFNLTTNRRSDGEVEQWQTDSQHLTWTVRHSDRFGDNGLIAVIHGRQTGTTLVIEDWVMSCRVFKRGIEDCLFNELVTHCQRAGITTIRGLFLPTERNQVVADLYARLGFVPEETESTANLPLTWVLDSVANYSPRSHTLQCINQVNCPSQATVSVSATPTVKEQNYESRVA